jgi:hypothetical protein
LIRPIRIITGNAGRHEHLIAVNAKPGFRVMGR